MSKVDYTSVCLLVDKEEIGSVGATGMHSSFFTDMVAELCALEGNDSAVYLRRVLSNSKVLSSDVSAAFDPNYPSVLEKKIRHTWVEVLYLTNIQVQEEKLAQTMPIAEYVAWIRKVMEMTDVSWQTAELGKVDQGGGGTIAYILGNLNMQVIDVWCCCILYACSLGDI